MTMRLQRMAFAGMQQLIERLTQHCAGLANRSVA
jgi:hypothetical protein